MIITQEVLDIVSPAAKDANGRYYTTDEGMLRLSEHLGFPHHDEMMHVYLAALEMLFDQPRET